MFYALIDFYAYQALKTITKHPWAPWIYFGTSLIVLGLFLGQLLSMGEARHTLPGGLYFFGLFLAFFVPKFLIGTFLLTEDLVRIIWGISRQFVAQPETFLPGRRRFVSNVAMITAALPFGALLYGMFRGKYQYQVLTYTLTFDDLPEAFDGYTIAHISDIHCGSFDDNEKVAYGISLVNEQNADLILFTGDLVNNRADELDRWQGVLGNLTAPDGVYSVLGNHDYGDYVPWASTEEK
ncbi:metallophosphoesterase, partial [Flavobacteriaceae bacterium]|nr:metallophosphoesterase [Flavobacteriaceae bacterium]